jgi:ATP adenylyltransferase
MAEFNENVWAPWRMEYIRSLDVEKEEEGCFLCRYWQQPDRDGANRVVWRSDGAFAVMNRFPYTNGHMLIAHAAHKGDMTDLSEDELFEMTRLTRDCVGLLRKTVHAQGFNVGYNIGRCAGAGLPDHLHLHVVPRWGGDTNFMPVVGDLRVIPDSLDKLHAELVLGAEKAGLR